MPKVSKLIFILMFPFIAQVLISCCDCREENVYYTFSRKDMEIVAFDNFNVNPNFNLSNGVSRNTFGIKLKFSREEIVEALPSISLFNSCYAYSCDCPIIPVISYSEQIESYSFVTLLDFDGEHPSGSDVSDLFMSYRNNEYESVPAFVNFLKDLSDYGKDDFEFDLLLMSPPSQSQDVKFKMTFTLSDGRVFESETETVTLN